MYSDGLDSVFRDQSLVTRSVPGNTLVFFVICIGQICHQQRKGQVSHSDGKVDVFSAEPQGCTLCIGWSGQCISPSIIGNS